MDTIIDQIKGGNTIRLDGNSNKLKDYPVTVFPEMITRYVYEAESVSNFEPAYILSSTIAAIGTAIGNKYKGALSDNYTVPTNFNVLLLGSSGSGKTPSNKAAIDPMIAHDIRAIESYQQEQNEYREREKQAKESGETFTEEQPKLIDRYIFKDTTIEALYSHLENSYNATLIVADEYLSFTKNWNKYNSGDARGQFLSWIDCSPITVDTKKDGTRFIKYPHISTIGGIQPDRLGDLFGSRSDGLTERFLIAYSDRPLKGYNDKQINQDAITDYKNVIQRAIEIPFNHDSEGKIAPRNIYLDTSAKRLYKDWTKDIAKRANRETSQTAKSIYTKMQSFAIRLATVLQATYYVCNEGNIAAITERAMTGAIELSEYYISASFRAHGEAHDNNPAKNLLGDKAKLYEALPNTFQTSEALEIAARLGINEREYYRLTSRKGLFNKLQRGVYEKAC